MYNELVVQPHLIIQRVCRLSPNTS